MGRKGEKDETVGLTKWVGAKTRAYNTRELLHQPVWQSSPTNLSLFLCRLFISSDYFLFLKHSFSFDLSQTDICKNRMFMNNCAMAKSNQSIQYNG